MSKQISADKYIQSRTSATDVSRNPHPERFWVDYAIEASCMAEARKLGRELCLEQTVELPGTLSLVQNVESYTVGTIERIHEVAPPYQSSSCCLKSSSSLFRVTIGFPNHTAGGELTQFLNVVFGNTSLKKGVAVANVTLSNELNENQKMFPGPKFGIQGIRDKLGVPQAPLLMTALKPMGASSQELADMAYHLAKGGIDIIKDDHGLANQIWAPFEERVSMIQKSIAKANLETGKNCLYAPCLNCAASQILDRAKFVQRIGAGAVMILPGISGWDVVRELASDPTFNLPVIIHPALLGGWLQSDDDDDDKQSHAHHPHGFAHELLFGVLPRICGGDAVIFPNAGGRFQFTPEECQAVADGCRRPMGRFAPILPSPAGGMKLSR